MNWAPHLRSPKAGLLIGPQPTRLIMMTIIIRRNKTKIGGEIGDKTKKINNSKSCCFQTMFNAGIFKGTWAHIRPAWPQQSFILFYWKKSLNMEIIFFKFSLSCFSFHYFFFFFFCHNKVEKKSLLLDSKQCLKIISPSI